MNSLVYFGDAVFFISKKDIFAAYEEIKNKFMFCDWMKNCQSLEDVLSHFGFDTESDEDGNFTGLNDVNIDYDNREIIEYILSVIAPYVENDSYIELYHDDAGHWRWIFRDNKCISVQGILTWEETEETAHECE